MRKGINLGCKNGKWRGGVTLNEKGYRRIMHGPNRNRYEHRVVMEEMLSAPIGLVFLPAAGIPAGSHVHHIDHNRQHNCPANLMLLDSAIHNALSRAHRTYMHEHWDEFVARFHQEEEVPF